jgi:hypothetical protein
LQPSIMKKAKRFLTNKWRRLKSIDMKYSPNGITL